jgi:hypothetical protein
LNLQEEKNTIKFLDIGSDAVNNKIITNSARAEFVMTLTSALDADNRADLFDAISRYKTIYEDRGPDQLNYYLR